MVPRYRSRGPWAILSDTAWTRCPNQRGAYWALPQSSASGFASATWPARSASMPLSVSRLWTRRFGLGLSHRCRQPRRSSATRYSARSSSPDCVRRNASVCTGTLPKRWRQPDAPPETSSGCSPTTGPLLRRGAPRPRRARGHAGRRTRRCELAPTRTPNGSTWSRSITPAICRSSTRPASV